MQAPAGAGSLKDIKEPETKFAAQYPFNHVKFLVWSRSRI